MEQNICFVMEAWGWGGSGGKFWNDGTFSGVRIIKLEYGMCLDSIYVIYDKQGLSFAANKHGRQGPAGSRGHTSVIKLEYPDEFLISVSGHYGSFRDPRRGFIDTFIRSLTFKSNHRTFGPYGVEEGTPFSFSSYPKYEIVGFHGRCSLQLDSFGLNLSHAKPRTLLPKDVTQKSFVVGPCGGPRGTNWDDGSFTGVRSISLFYGRHGIDAISFVYDCGFPFKTEKHGSGGDKNAEIMLQYPDEFLINVSGHYGPTAGSMGKGDTRILSLTFESNQRTFGPYGVEKGTPFTLPTHGRRILGFKGRSGCFGSSLHAIGFHLSGIV